ncbi:hypothetical protein [Fictibacillus sp. FJAT-27399]|uniref:hypothetical protein n=1 Tax=Fictibacillus sp. FJAT-27399 TaxID=1729689 RepID=UPI0012E3591D|nr:hypothetical protein [Fictibacillus sp. FJAT-27399]
MHSNQLINEDFLQKFSQFQNLLENSQKKKGCPRSLVAVDLRSRLLAFRGACGEPYRRERLLFGASACGSLTCHASPAGVSHLALQSTFH